MDLNELTVVVGGGIICGADSSFTEGCDDVYKTNIDESMKIELNVYT